jgi:predicted porin
MRKIGFVLGIATLAFAGGNVYAQSSVTFYGLISTGISYTNNVRVTGGQGHSLWQFYSGPQQLPRWGIKGVEDLGGGLSTIFTLENGFSIGTGTLSQGGREFGRQAFVGLSSRDLGTLTLGRQYDDASTLCWYESACQFAAFGAHIGDNDNVFDTFRVNNTVKYKSISYRGLQFEGTYSFSNQAGEFSDNNAYSAAISYFGPKISAGVAFMQVNKPNDANNSNGAVVNDYGFSSPFITNPVSKAGVNQQRMLGMGGAYKFDPASVSLLYTNTRFDYLDGSRLTLQNVEASLTDFVAPDFLVGAAYIFTTGRYEPQNSNPKWHQVNVGADYFLSKRTDVFLVGVFQRAAGDAQYAQIYSFSPSSTKSQLSAVVGMRTKW